METITLKAEVRDSSGPSVKQLRQSGLIPAVLYGKKQEAILLQVPNRELTRVLESAGTHQLISLQIDGQKKPHLTLARDIQRDFIKRHYLHVDFFAVNMENKVTADVPVVTEGEAPAVGVGGILTTGLDMLKVECLPSDLISAITVDITGLKEFNDRIIVADLEVPDTLTILSELDSMIFKIEAPRKREEEEELEGEEGVEEAAAPVVEE